jgi:uncharacterized protein
LDILTGIILLGVGLLAGGYGTIVGAGGGFIFVPALLLLLGMNPTTAAASGLVIVLINALSGVIGYSKQRKIQYKTGLIIGISALPGSLLGVWLLQTYSSHYFYIVFATILIALGFFLFSKNSPFGTKLKKRSRETDLAREEAGPALETPVESNGSTQVQKENNTASLTMDKKGKWLIPLGLVMGVLSSYLGIGGGWLLVPVLIYLFKVPTHYATATSIFSLCLYTSVGVISQLFYGNIDWMVVLWGGIGVIAGSQVGVLLSKKIPGKVIIQMLSILLIIIGGRMFFS